MRFFKYKNIAVLILSTAFFLELTGCSRSTAYKSQEENQYNNAPPANYYDKPGSDKTPSQRVEAMGQPKKRVVILNFWNDSPVNDTGMGEFAANELRRGLYLSERVIIPTDVTSKFETKDFVEGQQVRVAQLIREGRRIGVAVLIIGRISKVTFRQRGDDVGLLRQVQSMAAADLELKVFDVQSGREISALGNSGEASSNSMVAVEGDDLKSKQYRIELARLALREAVLKAVPDVLKTMEKMAWVGKVAKIIGTKVYLNAGRASGLVSGDILKVTTPGDDVYDPESGAYLGRTTGQLKGTLEINDFIGPDAAVAVIHTGGQFKEGDMVQLY